MKPSLRIFLAGLILGCLGAAWWFTRDKVEPIPDEKKVAMEVLVDTQAGPGYFHHADASAAPDEHGIFWIEPPAAEAQIDRIIRERKLDASSGDKLRKLIKQTTEPHPSRVVGGDRINLARLNVALDTLK
jgi:K+-transporting ATPase ATPase C chain